MDLIADTLLAAGAFGAGLYCYVLARRLREFQTLESGMGGAIAVLSAQVDDMTRALDRARGAAGDQVTQLAEQTRRAEQAVTRIELMLASMHDLPAPDVPAAVHDREEADPAPAAGRRVRFVRRRAPREVLEAAE